MSQRRVSDRSRPLTLKAINKSLNNDPQRQHTSSCVALASVCVATAAKGSMGEHEAKGVAPAWQPVCSAPEAVRPRIKRHF